MGFTPPDAKLALKTVNGNLERAVDMILSGNLPPQATR